MGARVEKIAKRSQTLRENPSLRIRVDIPGLRDLLDYVDFKCSAGSSVVRGEGEAIRGSDIDGGLIITRERVPRETCQKVIEKLRLDGFDVYSEVEYEEAKRDQARTGVKNGNLGHMWLNMIRFRTIAEIEEEVRTGDHFSIVRSVYLYGQSIR